MDLTADATVDWPRQGRRWPLPPALLASLVAHGLLLSLSFGQGTGLPGLEFPWQKRRTEVPELRVSLQPVPAAQQPAAMADAPPPAPPAAAGDPQPDTAAEAPPPKPAETTADLRLMAPDDAPTPAPPARELLAVHRHPLPVWDVQAASAVPSAVIAAMSAASAPALQPLARARETLTARRDHAAELTQLAAPRPDAAIAALQAASAPAIESLRRTGDGLRLRNERAADLAGLDGARALPTATVSTLSGAAGSGVESLRRASDGLRPSADGSRATELAQLDAARQQAQQGAQRLEAARLEALRQEAARAEAARQEAARAEAAQAEAVRQEAARIEAARAEAARLEAAKLAAAKAQAQAEEEQREARKRAIGRQLDEETAKRDAERQRPDWAPARRGRLFGRVDSNAALVSYGESWARKIENNVTPEAAREVARQPHTQAVVTVAVRSNGSVESVTFVRSSGVPAVDEAIRRIVQSQENYPAFPPALLRDYDVIEIRRTWQFDSAVRLN
ncbi:TonB family protein [Roseateles asaccharophilus]|uniref:TonB family protein n=1 Tax=Roseateles asaccharophilus TaxID=582607 RepID=A0ABU2A214_9BURK|nr:TonB family protein [Roseateles asaccharophilus]MDR7331237.1 TonB family protein [Roseateles asaccharophilus]